MSLVLRTPLCRSVGCCVSVCCVACQTITPPLDDGIHPALRKVTFFRAVADNRSSLVTRMRSGGECAFSDQASTCRQGRGQADRQVVALGVTGRVEHTLENDFEKEKNPSVVRSAGFDA